jgi:uncharacterized membrane protein YgdD (TMEM256/DUF423 family)
VAEENDEDEYYEEEDDTDFGPYYRQMGSQTALPHQGCLARVWGGCLHLIVTHIALYLCLGTMLLGGSILVKQLTRFGWHGISTIILGGLMILVYIIVVIAVVTAVSRLGKRITKDDNF